MKVSIKITALISSLMFFTPIWGKDKLLGAFVNNFHDIGGKVYAKGNNQLVIEGFTYDGEGPDAFFWIGTEGNEPSSNGIILTHPYEGKNYDKSDKKNAPKLEGLFDGSQDDIVLTLPDDINVKDLKWISIWCRRFGISFGQLIFPASSDNVDSDTETKTDVIASESGCKSNQNCIPLRECPYTFKLLKTVLSSNNREEKDNTIEELRSLVCKPSDRSVCCDLEGESEAEAEAEAEGYEEEAKPDDEEAKPEGDDEEVKPEGDEHEDDEEDGSTRLDHLMNHIVNDFPHKFGDISQLAEHELAGEVWALDEDTLEFRKFIYDGTGPDAYFMVGTHDAADKPNLEDGHPIPYSKDKVFPQKFWTNDDDIPTLPEFKSETFKLTLPPGIHVSDLKWLSVYCRKYTKDFGNISFE